MSISAMQTAALAQIALRSSITPETFDQLHKSGLLDDLFEASPEQIDRALFRKFLGLTPLELSAVVYFRQTLLQMIAMAKFNWMNPAITSEHFPILMDGDRRYLFKLYPNKEYATTSDEGLALATSEGFSAAGHEAGLAFAREFPNEQRKRTIVLLGATAEITGNRKVLYLTGENDRRCLNLENWSEGWRGKCAFLGAKEIPM